MKNNTLKTVLIVISNIIYYVLVIVLLFFGITGRQLADWYKATFHTTFREIIYTFGLGIKGADSSFMKEAVIECRYELATFCCVLAILFIYEFIWKEAFRLYKNRCEDIKGRRILQTSGITSKVLVIMIAFVLCVPTYKYADRILKINDFLKSRFVNTSIYEEHYVSINDVEVKAPETKRNLILIYLESMETTYASKDLGGYQSENYIPNLTKLAADNISFSDREKGKLGGIHNPVGTTWTTAAIMASESGVPFAFRIGKNFTGNEDNFAAGLPTLGDFLNSEGYGLYFMCGSDSIFGRKKTFFQKHGNYNIYDYYSAIDDSYIDKDYKVWWGLEDHKLYQIAKDKLTDISKNDEPFNFTLLTVDTHHVGGYKCEYCPDTYGINLKNVLLCADHQIQDFIDWCEKQDFFKDTTIVIIGDHPRMDTYLVKDVDFFEREAYNCFINPAKTGTVNEHRTATTVDLFPTILSSIGYSIEDDRLGLGTDLFSNTKTLAEELTYEEFNDELGKNSKYYIKNFN